MSNAEETIAGGRRASVVIATALPVEFAAVRAHLGDVAEVEHEAGTIYEVGAFTAPRGVWQVAVVQTGQGNPRAALEVDRAIAHFQPSRVFFVGVAGGLKDVQLGDVVAATKVYGYEFGKADAEYRPRLDFGESSYRLTQRAGAVARGSGWVGRIAPGEGAIATASPRAVVAPIAAGEKVVVSTRSATYQFLREHCSDAVAVEMEGYGFFRAIHANDTVRALAIRGISDLINQKEQADAAGWQEVAARHAAAFAFEVLAGIAVEDSQPGASDVPNVGGVGRDDHWERLIDVAAQLYPRGPEDAQIWSRAGGDVAALELNLAGRSAWFAALTKLHKGGGGAGITAPRLLGKMREEYPLNEELASLATVFV